MVAPLLPKGEKAATNVDTALLVIAQKWLGRGRGTKLGIARTDAVWSIAYRTLEGTTCVAEAVAVAPRQPQRHQHLLWTLGGVRTIQLINWTSAPATYSCKQESTFAPKEAHITPSISLPLIQKPLSPLLLLFLLGPSQASSFVLDTILLQL
ncbi:hypothetical protein O988_03321 [Pseudogymnoascus sp. VKM F-3808]|nr:hypothetical protein O988_03321 [Pseudogymnoascus sp. VKM F-3808]